MIREVIFNPDGFAVHHGSAVSAAALAVATGSAEAAVGAATTLVASGYTNLLSGTAVVATQSSDKTSSCNYRSGNDPW